MLGPGGSTPGNVPTCAFAAVDALVGTGKRLLPGLNRKTGLRPTELKSAKAATALGDYGVTVADGNSVWISSEYIGLHTCAIRELPFVTCGGTRTSLGNWDTRISKLTP